MKNKKMIRNLIKLLTLIDNKINLVKTDTGGMRIVQVESNINGRFKIFTINNPGLKESKSLVKSIFVTLNKDARFVDFCENKIIIAAAIINGQEYSFHHNVLIDSFTTFNDYWDAVRSHMKSNFGNSYGVSVIPMFKVRVWNGDELKNKHIKISSKAKGVKAKKVMSSILKHSNVAFSLYASTKLNLVNKHIVHSLVNPQFARAASTKAKTKKEAPSIKPYSETRLNRLSNSTTEGFAASDLETMEVNGLQIPVLITYVSEFETKYFMIDHELLKIDQVTALNKLWKEYFDYVTGFNIDKVFFHNLGAFDGYFLYKALLSYGNPEDISTIIDDSNKFITISYSTENMILTFKDSLRIFPMSLANLCKTFGVDGKLCKYNENFNKLDLFNNKDLLNKFIEYGVQDSVALYNALVNAQKQIFNDFKLDIAADNIVSTSSLAFNVFRSKFLKTEIPILNNSLDSFIRRGYFGGATDYYKKYVKNAKYYDANSLYPTAMLNDMPGKVVKFHNNLSRVKLDNFFGFALAEVTIPKETMRPLLPYKSKDGRTIFPTGCIVGVYFSEELKALAKLGYSIQLIKGYEFERINDLFSSFINHFYELKKHAKGAERALAKLIMNSSYGNFGRSNDLLITENVKNNELLDVIGTNIVKNIVRINDEYSTVLRLENLQQSIVNKLNIKIDSNFNNYKHRVSNNVAIASAITSYARIYMMDYKLSDSVIYTDTDSVIMTDEIDSSLIGPELGQMKDELNGGWMSEVYVLGIKQYGYHYINHQGGKNECSVFAGVPRNSISFNEFKLLSQGVTLHRELPVRFNKSFADLSIRIKPASIDIKANHAKDLVGNNYIPPHIIDLNHVLDTRSIINKLARKYWKLLKQYGG